MAQTAQQKQFEACLAPVLQAAYGTAFYLTRNRDEAEDLVQEASIRAYIAFATFQPGTNFKAWFLRVLTNIFLNHCRKQRREPDLVRWEGAADAYLSSLVSYNARLSNRAEPVAELFQKVSAQEIADAFAALPAEYQAACALYFMEDLSYQEIADIVDCPIGTVRSRIHRGRKVLQQALRSHVGLETLEEALQADSNRAVCLR